MIIGKEIEKLKEGGLSRDERIVLVNVAALILFFIAGAVTMGFAMIYVVVSKERRAAYMRIKHVKWIFVFAALAIATAAFYGNITGLLASVLLLLTLFFSVYVRMVMTPQLVSKIIRLSCGLSIVAALTGIMQKLMYFDSRISSLFYNPNYYAYISELIMILCVYALITIKKDRLFYSIAALANLAGLVFSGCRSAWPAIVIAIIVMLICLKKYRLVIAVAVIVVIGGVFISIHPSLIPRLVSIVTDKNKRMLIWENAFANFKKYPIFGQGFMTYYMISKDKIFYPHSHNIVLDYFLNFGVVGVASLAVYLGSHLIYSLKRIFQNPVCSIVIAVTVTTLVHGMTDVPTSAIQSGGLFIVYFSLAGTFKKPENTLETSKA